MSYNVSEEWYYYLRGRELILYQLLGGSTNERITQTGVLRTRDNELMYPNENISANETAGERITITQIPVEDSSPSETSHPNVNQMLCLAVVDYVKAMKAESQGDLSSKEYYIREFYSKLGDNESNKRNISVSFPTGPFAVK